MSDTVQSLKAAPLLASVGAQMGLQARDIQVFSFLMFHFLLFSKFLVVF